MKHLQDSLVGMGSSYATLQAYNMSQPENPNPLLGQVIVPILVGIVIPFLKDIYQDWRENRKRKRDSK